MGFAPTFYAGRPKLSEVTIDSDLDMGGRGILRVGRIDSPYRPETWPTETLSWGDGAASETRIVDGGVVATGNGTSFTILTAATDCNVGARLACSTGAPAGIFMGAELRVNGVAVRTHSAAIAPGNNHVFPAVNLGAGDILTVWCKSAHGALSSKADIDLIDTGLVVGAKTFDLTGKWLAVGLDMKGLAATVKIQGVEMPYSEYVKGFPLAPTELKFPGGWDALQVRPIVEVYV